MSAAQGGFSEIVKVLVDKSADVSIQGQKGWNALMFAAQNRHKDIVKYLLDKALLMAHNMKNNDGLTSV